MRPLLGIGCFIFFAYLLSTNRKAILWPQVAAGIALQILLVICVLGIPGWKWTGFLRPAFYYMQVTVTALLNFTAAGSKFLFGPLMDPSNVGFIFALQILPSIVFISSLMSLLYHIGVMQRVIQILAQALRTLLRVSGAESVATAANIFVGQVEAPLIIAPYVPSMTRSEIFSVMVGGMATVAGSVFAAYVGLLQDYVPDIAGHLLTASILSAPAALVIAKVMIPETEVPKTLGQIPKIKSESPSSNLIEATADGATRGLKLALNVGTILLAFIALIALIDQVLMTLGQWIDFPQWGRSLVSPVLHSDGQAHLSLSVIFSWIFSPLSWLMGIPWNECLVAGALLGEKVALNEFVAYSHLSQIAKDLSDETIITLSYALCGFANFASIAIQIGGIGNLAPSQKANIAKLGVKAVIGGSLAAFMTASMANLFL